MVLKDECNEVNIKGTAILRDTRDNIIDKEKVLVLIKTLRSDLEVAWEDGEYSSIRDMVDIFERKVEEL